MKHLEQCWASAKKCYYFYFGISFTFFFSLFFKLEGKKILVLTFLGLEWGKSVNSMKL